MSVVTIKQKWQTALSSMVTDPQELFELLGLNPMYLPAAYDAAKAFPLKVTRSYLNRIAPGDMNDPLLKQILPLGIELEAHPEYLDDPLKEKATNPVPGLLHKYHGRVLVMLTSACAIHCRYCFRREFPYADNISGKANWDNMIAYIANDASITEVIFSGGDPLSVGDDLLRSFTQRLNSIPHVTTLRIHTRLPVVLPERITGSFLEWVRQLALKLVMVLHVNHPNEINHDVAEVVQILRGAGVVLLNQSVLLRGVNDTAETLVTLSRKLFAMAVLPYYLHVLDKVNGAAHFDVPLAAAKLLHAEMTKNLPGYLVPRLVREDAGALSKTWL